MEHYKLIAIVGKAGSGKDSIAKTLIEQFQDEKIEAHEIISYTTRPPRDYEIDGIDYHFISKEELLNLILDNKMLEVSEFNNWFYGTCINNLKKDKINIGVFNPEGVESISQDNRIDMFIVYCICNDKERIIRQLNREFDPDIDEILRRFKTDKEDFSDFKPGKYSPYFMEINTDRDLSISEEAGTILTHTRNWTALEQF